MTAWKVELIAVNADEKDNKTIKQSLSRYSDYLHFSFRVSGGVPGEKITLTHSIVWPDGHTTRSSWHWENVRNGEMIGCEWSHGLFSSSGTAGNLTIKVYNKATGELLCEASIKLT